MTSVGFSLRIKFNISTSKTTGKILLRSYMVILKDLNYNAVDKSQERVSFHKHFKSIWVSRMKETDTVKVT